MLTQVFIETNHNVFRFRFPFLKRNRKQIGQNCGEKRKLHNEFNPPVDATVYAEKHSQVMET